MKAELLDTINMKYEIVYWGQEMIRISLKQTSGLIKLIKNGQKDQDYEFFIKNNKYLKTMHDSFEV